MINLRDSASSCKTTNTEKLKKHSSEVETQNILKNVRIVWKAINLMAAKPVKEFERAWN